MPYRTAYILLVAASAASCAHSISTRADSFENQSNASLPVGQVRVQPDNAEERGRLFQETIENMKKMTNEGKVVIFNHAIRDSPINKDPDVIMQNLWREFKQHENLPEELATLDHLVPNLQDLLRPPFFDFIRQDKVRLAKWMQWHNLKAQAWAQKIERTQAKDADMIMQNLWREFKQHENLQEELATLDHLAPNLQDLLLSRFFAFIQQDQVRLANWMQWQKLIAHASAQKHEQAMVHATTATAEIHPSGDIEGVLLTLWKEFTQPMLLLEGATPPRSESEVHMFLAFVREDQNRLKLLQSWIEWRETSTGKEATVDDVYTALVHATTN